MVNTNLIVRVLRRMASNVQMESVESDLDRLVFEIKHASNPFHYMSAIRTLREYVIQKTNEETYNSLIERLTDHDMIWPTIKNQNLSTYDGFMDAVEEVLEMFSGAAIGGAFDGAQSNANANATGMAAPNSPSKKKKRKTIDSILNKRF